MALWSTNEYLAIREIGLPVPVRAPEARVGNVIGVSWMVQDNFGSDLPIHSVQQQVLVGFEAAAYGRIDRDNGDIVASDRLVIRVSQQ